MSLLMKALEKAAKDRAEARAEAASAPATVSAQATRAELSLEPLGVEQAARPEAAAHAAPAPSAPAREQAQAAAILQAGARAGRGGALAYVRTHPLVAVAAVAGLVALAFGIYVYREISQPGLARTAPPRAPLATPPVAQATVPPAAAPLASAPVVQAGAAEGREPEPAAAPAPAKPKPPAAAEPAPAETPRSTIRVSPGSPEPALNPLLAQAYSALEQQQLAEAKALYGRVLRSEPRNTDALLGLAAAATLEGDHDEAVTLFLRILELEPRHALAQSGLLGLLGRADPLAAESRLKQLIAREPSAFLHFTLGNLYADQSQWAQAQHAYFQAYHLEPSNPDYAYNLAVGLEHVSQPKLALGFYRRALELAAAKGRAGFDLARARERMAQLASQVE